MIIIVEWYRRSGKYHEGGRVDLGYDVSLGKGIQAFMQAIVDRQPFLIDGWQRHKEYYVVTRDIPESEANPNFRGFNSRHFKLDEFAGFEKSPFHQDIVDY